MNRRWTLAVVGAVIVIAAAIVVVVLGRQDDPKQTPAAQSPTTGTPSPTASTAAVLPLSERAGIGLRKFVAANPITTRRPVLSLDSCPYGSVRFNAGVLDRAAGATSADFEVGQAIVQRYRIKVPYNGTVGNRGVAVSCFGRRDSRVYLGLSATTNVTPVPTGPIKGLDGPKAYQDGQTYSKTTRGAVCSVYWVPPKRDYELVVIFRSETEPSLDDCRRGFAAVAPKLLYPLAKLAG